jgi:ATP-binding cassette subfamily B protein
MRPRPNPQNELKSWRDRIAALRHLPPLFAEVWLTHPAYAFCSLFSRLATALLPIAVLYVAKLLVDEAVALATGSVLLDGRSASQEALWRYFAIEVVLVLLTDLLGRLQGFSDAMLGELFSNRMTVKMIRHAASLDLATFEDPQFQDRLDRARRQTSDRLNVLFLVASMLQQGLGLAVMSLTVIAFSPWFLGLLLVSLAPVFWSEAHFAALGYALLYRWTPERRETDYLRLLGASHTTAKEVKIFGLSAYFVQRIEGLLNRYFTESKQLAVRRTWTNSLLGLLPTAAYYASLAYILLQTLARVISIGDWIFLSRIFSQARGLLVQIFQGLSRVAEQSLYVRDLYEFFETKPQLAVREGALPAPRVWSEGIRFENVEFAYPEGQPVLRGISFALAPGEKIALLGENGAGKTTIVKLLCRLYDPTAGRILLDGVDLRDYDPESLRAQIGVIFQDFLKYDMLVRENIGLGNTLVMNDAARLRQAAEKSYADSVIAALPQGDATMLGRRFAGGVELSQGQWQKIALARAYMRDANLLILDEPTASLDARAEYEVFERFANLTEGKSAVLISHRFSTVRMADQILVLEEGKILEQGSHQDLLRRQGRYAELFELQAAGYR